MASFLGEFFGAVKLPRLETLSVTSLKSKLTPSLIKGQSWLITFLIRPYFFGGVVLGGYP